MKTIETWFLWLMIYSIIGWVYESTICSIRHRKLINRGFLNAPFSPVYGEAAVLFAVFLPELKSAPFFLFVGGMLLATALELVTGALLERIFGQKWWDYSQEPWNFNGHICLKYSLVWGVLALFCLFLGNPLLVTLTNWIPRSVGQIIAIAVLVLLAADFAGSGAALLQLNGSLKEPSEVSRRWRAVSNALDNAVTRYIQRRMARAYPSLDKDRLKRERRKEKVRAQVFAQGCGFYKLTWIFVIAALLGDLFETVFCRFSMGEWQSRSSLLYGPVSLVWGLGALLMALILFPLRRYGAWAVFAGGVILGGCFEYLASLFLELTYHRLFWNYSHLPLNLDGRTNLLYAVFWGVAGLIWIERLVPYLLRQMEKVSARSGRTAAAVVNKYVCLAKVRKHSLYCSVELLS